MYFVPVFVGAGRDTIAGAMACAESGARPMSVYFKGLSLRVGGVGRVGGTMGGYVVM